MRTESVKSVFKPYLFKTVVLLGFTADPQVEGCTIIV